MAIQLDRVRVSNEWVWRRLIPLCLIRVVAQMEKITKATMTSNSVNPAARLSVRIALFMRIDLVDNTGKTIAVQLMNASWIGFQPEG